MLLIILITLSFQGKAAKVIAERIIFLNEDSKTYLSYSTNRSDYSSYRLWFSKEDFPTTDDALSSYLYFYPNEYQWESDSDTHHILRIFQGDYARLVQNTFKDELKTDDSGIFTYCNWDGETKTDEGHYGSWNSPDNFTQYMYVWVIPESFEIIDFKCNREGEWVRRKNTIAYYGSDVNDLVFTIQFERKNQDTFNSLSQLMGGNSQVQIQQESEGTRITLEEGVLFPSGDSELNSAGTKIMDRLTETLKKRNDIIVTIAGHTDNQPIQGDLARIYPSNWELSSARALSVLHFMINAGMEESKLEVRAYGSTQPVATNSTPEGRAKNRRIDLLIQNKQ